MKKYLTRARVNKNDEFYTRLEDIEDELKHYDLSGKVVYCNCDDPHKSNFVKYFIDNFNELGIDSVRNKNKPDGIYLYDVCYIDEDTNSWGDRYHTWEDIIEWKFIK